MDRANSERGQLSVTIPQGSDTSNWVYVGSYGGGSVFPDSAFVGTNLTVEVGASVQAASAAGSLLQSDNTAAPAIPVLADAYGVIPTGIYYVAIVRFKSDVVQAAGPSVLSLHLKA